MQVSRDQARQFVKARIVCARKCRQWLTVLRDRFRASDAVTDHRLNGLGDAR
jgi:hypothetical protein